jgi:hypothetical protein
MKLFTKEVDKQLFAQYPKGSDIDNQMVVAKIFNPYGRGVWYLLNSDPEDPDYIWAIVDLFEPEMGSVSRSELQTVKVPPFGLGLERDIYFTPKPAKEVFEGVLSGKRYAAGGMTPGRYYIDNSGNELRYVGESQGKLLFKDGEKVVTKSEEDFEDRPKETKLFGFFEKGGEIAQENNEMLQSNIVELKHHADELDKIVTNKTEVEPWVIAKTERASTDLSDVTHYLDGEKKKGLKMPFEKGGYMARGGEITPYIVWVSKDGEERELYGEYKSKRAADMKLNKLWESGEYKQMGNKPKSMYQKEGFYANGGRVKGRNNETGETYGVVIGSVQKSDEYVEGGTEMNVRTSYSSRISESKVVFDTNANLYGILDYGYAVEGYPSTNGGSFHAYNADKKETLQILSKKYNPAFAKKLIELAKNPKMAHGGETNGKRYKVNVYYGGEMEDEEFYTDSLDEAQRASQGGEHSEIYDNHKKEFVEIEYAKGGNTESYEVELSAESNPDYEKSSYEGSINIKSHKVKAKSIENARDIVVAFIMENDLGGGNWSGGNVYKNGKKIGHVSYNGRYWDDTKMAKGGKLPETIGGYKIDFSKWREDVIATIEVKPNSAPFEPFYLKGVGKTEKQAFQNLEKEYNSMKKSSYVVTFSIDDSRWIKSKPISAYTEEQASNILYESASMEGDVSILKIDKMMAKGGKLVGKQKNLDVNKNGKLDAEDFKMLRGEKMADGGGLNDKAAKQAFNKGVIDVMADDFVKKLKTKGISATKKSSKNGVFVYGEKRENGKYKYETYISYSELPSNEFLEFEESEFVRLHKKMAMGGKVKFEDKVKSIKESLLKRKKVSPKVQKDYGKTYSPKEAEESAKRIAASQRMKYELKKKFKKGGKTIAQTPALKKDRVFGSSTNKAGSASSKKSASNIELNESIVKTLGDKAKAYNEKHSSKVSTSTLKAVMRRGMGAFSTSHRPGMSRQGWGYARVNKFLQKKGGAKVKAAYVQDDDLL